MIKVFRPTILCVLLIAGASICVRSQYRFDSWTTDNGLPQNGVRAITQSPDGYLWFTTFDGLVRFDGVKFTVFNKANSAGIINNRFWAVRAFNDGTIWAATEGGDLTIYRDGTFISYSAEQVPGDLIYGFDRETSGEVLINTGSRLYALRDGGFVLVRQSEDNGTQKRIYTSAAGTRWEVFPTETRQINAEKSITYALSIKYLNFYASTCFEDSRGGLWLTDMGKIHYLRDGRITAYEAKDGIPSGVIGHDIWEDADGSIWFATGDYNTQGKGLFRFKDGKFTNFGVDLGLSNDRIFSVFHDREGTAWLATDKGLNRLRRQMITTLSTKDGLVHNEVYPMLRTRDGSIYVGTVGGLSVYRDGKFTSILLRTQDKQGTASVQSLFEDADGTLWIGVVGGLFSLEGGRARDRTAMLDRPDTIYSINASADGIWFGSEHYGVALYRDGKFAARYTTAEGLAGNDVKTILNARDGSVWFGTFGGLSHYKDGKFTSYTTADGLASNFVRFISEDADGTLWVGTYDGGLSRFRDGKFATFNKDNGLFSNGVFSVVDDGRGNFWMSSNQGIYRASRDQLNAFADGRIDHYDSVAYGKDDGMLSTECNGGRQPSSVVDNEGRIWFPTLEGIAVVDPGLLPPNGEPPTVEIESVEVDRGPVTMSDAIRIDPSEHYLDITYTALSFIKSDQIRFRYRLEGLDQDWIDAGTRRTANFSYLPPGEYTFTVTAANTDGVWHPAGRSVKVVVLAPFYKTWWFALAVLLLLAAIGYLIYTYRIRQLKTLNAAHEMFARQLIDSQEAERKRIAQEVHDGLGQSLLVIKNRAALGLAAGERAKADEQFNEITGSVTDALAEVRVISHNLRPLHLERLGLASTIEEMIEQVDEASDVEINCDIAKIDGLLTPENEMNLYRIVQECLNNIVKHSAATRASVSVERNGPNIVVNIRDDGRGFDREAAGHKHGLGLSGIAERVRILGGTYLLETNPGSGTTVVVEVPIG